MTAGFIEGKYLGSIHHMNLWWHYKVLLKETWPPLKLMGCVYDNQVRSGNRDQTLRDQTFPLQCMKENPYLQPLNNLKQT